MHRVVLRFVRLTPSRRVQPTNPPLWHARGVTLFVRVSPMQTELLYRSTTMKAAGVGGGLAVVAVCGDARDHR